MPVKTQALATRNQPRGRPPGGQRAGGYPRVPALRAAEAVAAVEALVAGAAADGDVISMLLGRYVV